MNNFIKHEEGIYLSYDWLTQQKVSIKTINHWVERRQATIKKVGGNAFVLYDSIPVPTRSKLPSKEALLTQLALEKEQDSVDECTGRLMYARDRHFPQYREIYQRMGLSPEKVTEYAKHHAVWATIVELHAERFGLRNLWNAYCKLYPNRHVYNSMNRCINICNNDGIERLLVRKVSEGTKIYDARYELWVMEKLSSGKKYTQKQVHEYLCKQCDLKGLTKPSLSWTKQTCVKLLSTVSVGRFGADECYYKELPYMGIIPAENPNDQWQCDGWRLPFYYNDNGLKTLTLFWVIDACTGKVLGSYVDRSENTDTILKGMENAVATAKVLPFEIVSDNHSFQNTGEAKSFKETIGKIGTTWTVTSNPRYKGKVERSFGTFGNSFCKNEHGYIGQGIKTRVKEGRTSQELVDKYLKKCLTPAQITLIAGRCIEQYNNTKGKDGKTPNERYDEAMKSKETKHSSFPVTELDLAYLFIREKKIKSGQGQISFERAGVQYEFEFTAKQSPVLNGKEFTIRYLDDKDELMLFDPQTDEYIDTVRRKRYAHGALANQTEEDKELFLKHKGRQSGILTDKKRKQADIIKRALEIDPEAAYAMNPRMTPKATFEEYKENGVLADFAYRHGINVDNVPDIPSFSECNIIDLEKECQKKDRRREQPITVTQEEIDNFCLSDYLLEE